MAWLQTQRPTDLLISVISIGEIERGIAQQKHKDQAFAADLADWLDRLLRVYAGRILDLDVSCARQWGVLSADIGNKSADLLIAATAINHGLTVATGNTKHFHRTGVATFDPFTRVH